MLTPRFDAGDATKDKKYYWEIDGVGHFFNLNKWVS